MIAVALACIEQVLPEYIRRNHIDKDIVAEDIHVDWRVRPIRIPCPAGDHCTVCCIVKSLKCETLSVQGPGDQARRNRNNESQE